MKIGLWMSEAFDSQGADIEEKAIEGRITPSLSSISAPWLSKDSLIHKPIYIKTLEEAQHRPITDYQSLCNCIRSAAINQTPNRHVH